MVSPSIFTDRTNFTLVVKQQKQKTLYTINGFSEP